MALTVTQRLDRVRVRLEELFYWRERETASIGGWTFEGKPIALGQGWPTRDGVIRFAARAEIPAHWPLAETRLQLNLGGEGLVKVDYPDGANASFGNDPYHQEFPVRGHSFTISSETVERLPFGEPVRNPIFTDAQVAWLDLPVHQFHLRLKQVYEACVQLEDHEVMPHLVAAAEAAFHSLNWPSSTETYNARFAPQPGQQKIWQLPPLIENPVGLTDEQRQSVIDADAQLVETLRALQGRFPPQGEIALTGHAHIDLAWLWPYAETRRKARRTFHTAISLMEGGNEYLANSGFIFNQSTAHYYVQIEEDDPALFEKMRAKVAAGSWDPVGGLWIEPDTNMPTGESLVRQVLYGQRYFEQKFGRRHEVCWLPDCFGFSGAMPQILRQGGITSFFTIKVNWSETNKFPADLFWWEGLDGTRVLAHTFENPWHGYNGAVNPECLFMTWKNFRGKTVHNESLLAVGYGDGGGGVTPEYVEREMQLRDFPALPKARWSTVDGFFARMHETAKTATLPVWQNDIYLELHRATLTTQSAVKKLHRQAERALITAETLGSLAALMGAALPPSMEEAWRIVLKNEFHDILPGSSIAEVYEDAENELTDAISRGKKEQAASFGRLIATLPKGGIADAAVAVNPSLSPRRLANGATIPPLGIMVLDSAVEAPAELAVDHDSDTGTHAIENKHLRAVIAKDGTVASLVHKASGREALAGRGNQLWVYPNDKPRNWDAWDIEDDYAKSGIELVAESIETFGPVGDNAGIKVMRRFRDSTVTQIYGLRSDSRRLEIETTIDWHDRHCFLRTYTPVAVRTTHATFEHAHGVVRRATHDNTSWEQAQFEVPAHRFVDMSEPGFGVALLNDAKYGHSAKGNVLGLSLVRSPVYPDPMADEGEQTFTYALYPHEGEWHEGGVREEAEDLNQPVLWANGSGLAAGTYTPVTVEGVPAALSGFKRAEEGDGLVLRVYEPSGRRGSFTLGLPPGWKNRGAVSIMEEPMDAGEGLRPFEVKSWRLAKG
jgi:alpha-mannosidase